MITNYLSPVEFQLTIKRMPSVEFFIQRLTIPSISSNPITQPTPLNPIFQQPDSLTYSELDVSFVIDETMQNYMEVFNWMTSVSFPQSNEQFKQIEESEEGLYSDISVLIQNSHKNANIVFDFKNCFPIGLSQIELDTTAQDVQYPQASVTFKYDYFTIRPYANG